MLKYDEKDTVILSWNVHCSKGARIERQKSIAEFLLSYDPDIIFLTEFYLSGCLVLDRALSNNYPYRSTILSDEICGNIVYSKFPILKEDSIKNEKGDNMCVTYHDIDVNSKIIRFINAHLVSSDGTGVMNLNKTSFIANIFFYFKRYLRKQKKRICQVNRIIPEIRNKTIVLGDMNDFHFSKPLRMFEKYGMKNAWSEKGRGYGCTFHKGCLKLRIDHVYHTNDIDIENTQVFNTRLSDHNPIFISFTLSDIVNLT